MRRFVSRWWAFALLCFASLSRLVLADNFPVVLPTCASLAAATGLLAIGCAAYLAANRVPPPRLKNEIALAALGGALFLCGPFCPLFFYAHDIVESDIFLAGSLVPVVVAVASAARSNASLSGRILLPGVAASAAFLLLFAEPRIQSLAGALTFALLPIATGVGAVFVSETAQQNGGWQAVLALLGARLVFSCSVAIPRTRMDVFAWQACGFDMLVLGVTLLCISRIHAMRYSAYFVLVPFAVTLYGLLLFRPTTGLRMVFGLAILLASAVALLNSRNSADDGSFRLLS